MRLEKAEDAFNLPPVDLEVLTQQSVEADSLLQPASGGRLRNCNFGSRGWFNEL